MAETRMLYIVTLPYLRPRSDLEAHLDSHRDWLLEHTRAGRILAAGPLDPGTGGLILAHCAHRAELDGMLDEDAFHIHQLVDRHVQGFAPAMRAAGFPAAWGPQAKAV